MLPKRKIGFGYIVGKLIICNSLEPVSLLFKRGQESFYQIWKQGTLNMEKKTLKC